MRQLVKLIFFIQISLFVSLLSFQSKQVTINCVSLVNHPKQSDSQLISPTLDLSNIDQLSQFQWLDNIDSLMFNSSKDLITSLTSSLSDLYQNVPNVRQVILLISILIYLMVNIAFMFASVIIANFSTISQLFHDHGELSIFKNFFQLDHFNVFGRFLDRIDQLFYFVGFSQSCKETLVCKAGVSIASDFPKISQLLASTIRKLTENHHESLNKLTQMLLDAMNLTGRCYQDPRPTCPELNKFQSWNGYDDHHVTHVASAVISSAYQESVHRVALGISAVVVFLITIFIGGILIILFKRTPRSSIINHQTTKKLLNSTSFLSISGDWLKIN